MTDMERKDESARMERSARTIGGDGLRRLSEGRASPSSVWCGIELRRGFGARGRGDACARRSRCGGESNINRGRP